MDKKSLIIVLIILTLGIILSNNSNFFKISGKDTVVRNFNTASPASYAEEATLNEGASQVAVRVSFSDVIEKIAPSLVNISAVHIVEVQTPFHRFYFGDSFFDEFFDDFFSRPRRRKSPQPETRKHRYEGTGSGFIVASGGYVLTNYHVVKDAKEIKVVTHDDKTYTAELVGRDPKTDLAVIKIKSSRKFNALKMGNSNAIKIGDWVIAGGSPFGLKQTFTAGIISALRQDVQVENMNYRDMIQTDASINRGNSGGPLVNLDGEVVGINTAIFAPTGVFAGIGFAIPINQAKKILSQLIEKGKVVRGWLGIEIKDVDEAVKKHFNLKSDSGVLINRVFEDSHAQKGGLKRGDIIMKFNKAAIEDVRDLQEKVADSKPGQKVSLTIIRDGTEKVFKIELGEMPDEFPAVSKKEKDTPVKDEISQWKGISVINITGLIKEKYSLTISEGVIIAEIDPAEDGYEIGLRMGDVVVQMNNVAIKNIEDFDSVVKKASLEEGVVFDIIRDGRPLYISYQKIR